MVINKYIEIDPRRCNGKPVVTGTRIPVSVIIDQLAEVGTIDGLLRKYPELSHEVIVAVLRYCNTLIEHSDIEMAKA